MSAPSLSTREKLLSIIDDVEIITKEILENAISIKHQRMIGAEQLSLTKLLIAKEKELKDTLKLADEQAKINEKMNLLKNEVERQDQYIQQFERLLKESEQILATANFQAKQKLQSINKANKRPVSSEELIKYAHRISSSEAVCAPLTWQPGDPRRPYPTDIDMRLGLLSRYNDPPINGHMIPQPGNLPDIHRSNHPQGTNEPPASIANQFAWHTSGEMHMSVPGQSSVSIDTRNHNKDNEDVEVMSTDSSSSSSSDSQ
ncbi:mediator of RNA polymerase II transcription subunit 4 [Planococcus citri]|uniref:mediator of RNA polymerase II transcription subunit 4 n=1 Tax=Planococcus citri TaxID=170843 RepID=UPI0031F98FEE